MATTKITNSVIQSNTIISDLIANNQIITRHILDGEVTLAKLSFPLSAEGNADMVQSNLTVLIQDDFSFFSTKVFQNVQSANTLVVVRGTHQLFAVAHDANIIEANGSVFEMKMNLQLLGPHTATMSNDPTSALHVATKAYVDNVSGGSTTIDDGTAADPGFVYTNEADMGLWKPAANTMGFSIAGTDRWDIDAVAIFPVANIAYDIGKDAANFVKTVFTENLIANAGVVTRPAITFKDDENTGLYHIGADILGIAVGGVEVVRFTGSQFRSGQIFEGPAGTVSLPTYSFTGDPNTGFYNETGDEIGVSTGGLRIGHWANQSLTANTVGIINNGTHLNRFSNINFSGTGITSITNDNFGNVDIVITAGAGTTDWPDGTPADPGLENQSEVDQGLYRDTANVLGIAVAGAGRVEVSVTALQPVANLGVDYGSHPSNYIKTIFTQNLLSNGGTSIRPVYSFQEEPDTGMYGDIPADTLGFTTAGTKRFTLNATATQSTVAFRTAGGSAATPTYSFTGDPNTGFFNAVADEIAVSIGGVQAGVWRQGNLQANTVGAGVFDATLAGRFANVLFTNVQSVASTNFGNVTIDVGTTIGKHSIWVPATAMAETVTAGCSVLTAVETTAGRPDLLVRDFATAADDHAQFSIAFPDTWNKNTLTFKAYWTTAGAVSTGIAIGLQALSVGDNESIDAVFGTANVMIDDAQGAANELYIVAESGAITVGGTPANGETVFFDVFRDVSDTNDDMTQDMRLIGLKIFYTTDKQAEV